MPCLLSIVHEADAGPGVFAEAVEPAGFEVVEWVPGRTDPPQPGDFDALWTFGGSMHPDQHEAHPWLIEEIALLAGALEEDKPVLGVCLGAQVVAAAAGSQPRAAARPEVGWFDVALTSAGREDPVLGPGGSPFDAFEWHSYEIPLPAGGVELARNDLCLQAFRVGEAAWGIQFHAEVTRTDTLGWIRDYGPEAGIDQDTLTEESERKIAGWNDYGRGLAARFLETAAERQAGSSAIGVR
jgi:GMP synthase-like glutamine amidotransferase